MKDFLKSTAFFFIVALTILMLSILIVGWCLIGIKSTMIILGIYAGFVAIISITYFVLIKMGFFSDRK